MQSYWSVTKNKWMIFPIKLVFIFTKDKLKRSFNKRNKYIHMSDVHSREKSIVG